MLTEGFIALIMGLKFKINPVVDEVVMEDRNYISEIVSTYEPLGRLVYDDKGSTAVWADLVNNLSPPQIFRRSSQTAKDGECESESDGCS